MSASPLNHAAGNLFAGIARGLGREIIRLVVNNDCPADYLIYRKAIGQKQGKRKSTISEQRGKVACVVRMFKVAGVVVRHSVCKRIIHVAAAVGPAVDMESKNMLMAVHLSFRQPHDFG